MPQREYSKTKTYVTRANKRLTLPIEWERYKTIVEDTTAFRAWLDTMIVTYPELFPAMIDQGYSLHDQRTSTKMPEVTLRRIKLKAADKQGKQPVFTIAPSAVMPYMTGYTDEVEKALFLRRFGVPFWALAYVFGRDEQYWFRQVGQFGAYEIVGTTVKDPDKLPTHLLADEKHTRFNGEKAYIATTVGEDCVLGASVALTADEEALTDAYSHFKEEARHLCPDYQPQTVNTDGWRATQNAWLTLFPLIVIIECFLHAFLKIRDRCKRKFKAVYPDIQQRVWDIYHASDPAQFWERVAALDRWATEAVSGAAREAIAKLCAKADRFVLAFDHPDAYRTSNMVDRHIDPMDRWLTSARFFHGHWLSAERQTRAWAVLHNFWPYCPRPKISQTYQSPTHRLNDRRYHDNWLHNLLISTQWSGQDANHKKH